MQANDRNDDRELLCIRTKKVYDWVVNDSNFDFTVENLPFDFNTRGSEDQCDDIANVTCDITDVDVKPLEHTRKKKKVFIDGEKVELEEVTIKKEIEFKVTVTLKNGDKDTQSGLTKTFFEKVLLCAPYGTDIDVEVTDHDCSVLDIKCTNTGTNPDFRLDVHISVRICQSIVVTFPVILELFADFCEPRDVLPISSTPCPLPYRPEQCPVIFPEDEE